MKNIYAKNTLTIYCAHKTKTFTKNILAKTSSHKQNPRKHYIFKNFFLLFFGRIKCFRCKEVRLSRKYLWRIKIN